jgi:hypothetical protein
LRCTLTNWFPLSVALNGFLYVTNSEAEEQRDANLGTPTRLQDLRVFRLDALVTYDMLPPW